MWGIHHLCLALICEKPQAVKGYEILINVMKWRSCCCQMFVQGMKDTKSCDRCCETTLCHCTVLSHAATAKQSAADWQLQNASAPPTSGSKNTDHIACLPKTVFLLPKQLKYTLIFLEGNWGSNLNALWWMTLLMFRCSMWNSGQINLACTVIHPAHLTQEPS